MPRLVFYVAAWLLALADGAAPAFHAPSLHPVREVDLRSLGPHIGPPWLYHLVEFVSNDMLAVGFVARNPRPPTLARRGEAAGQSPFLLKLALVNVTTGQILKQTAWPTESAHSGLVAAPGSMVLVLLGDWVCLYNDRLDLARRLQLPRVSESGWLARVSPSGRNVLLIQDTGPKPGTWAWLDLGGFRVERAWSLATPPPPAISISDEYVAIIQCHEGNRPLPCELIVQTRDRGLTVLSEPVTYFGGLPHFTSSDVLFTRRLPLPPVGFSLIRLGEGRARTRSEPSLNGFTVGSPATGTRASRFVVPILNPARQPEYVFVFDGSWPRWHALRIQRIRGFRWPPDVLKSARWLALSPDGSLLAIMPSFETLLIYKLPAPKSR